MVQDHVQVGAVVQKIKQIFKEKNPSVKEMFIQSDNSTCFSSQELVLFLFHLNEISSEYTIKLCICTEAQTVQGILDTYFSYISVVMKSYVDSYNNIDMEEDIFK